MELCGMELFYISQLLILLKNKIGFFKCLTESKFIGRILLFSFLCIAEAKPRALGIRKE